MKNETVSDFALRKRQVYEHFAGSFLHIFEVSLKTYWDPLTGFDLVKFDTEIIGSGDKAAKDVLIEKYGTIGVEIILALIAEDIESGIPEVS